MLVCNTIFLSVYIYTIKICGGYLEGKPHFMESGIFITHSPTISNSMQSSGFGVSWKIFSGEFFSTLGNLFSLVFICEKDFVPQFSTR